MEKNESRSDRFSTEIQMRFKSSGSTVGTYTIKFPFTEYWKKTINKWDQFYCPLQKLGIQRSLGPRCIL